MEEPRRTDRTVNMRAKKSPKSRRDEVRTSTFEIGKAPFFRHVKEIGNRITVEPLRWSPQALNILQESTEEFLENLFADTYLCAIHANRVTIQSKDLWLAYRFRGPLVPHVPLVPMGDAE